MGVGIIAMFLGGGWKVDVVSRSASTRDGLPAATARALAAMGKPDNVSGLATYATLEEALRSPLSSWSPLLVPDGSAGKMFPVVCQPTEDGLLLPSSGGFKNSGMASPGGCWTLSTSEWTAFPEESLSGEGVCSLSDILQETSDVPQQFFLSPKAAAGIIRRAASRGKKLPEGLGQALQEVAGSLSPKSVEP